MEEIIDKQLQVLNSSAYSAFSAVFIHRPLASAQLCGITGAPSIRNCVPETITLSPGLMPSCTS